MVKDYYPISIEKLHNEIKEEEKVKYMIHNNFCLYKYTKGKNKNKLKKIKDSNSKSLELISLPSFTDINNLNIKKDNSTQTDSITSQESQKTQKCNLDRLTPKIFNKHKKFLEIFINNIQNLLKKEKFLQNNCNNLLTNLLPIPNPLT